MAIIATWFISGNNLEEEPHNCQFQLPLIVDEDGIGSVSSYGIRLFAEEVYSTSQRHREAKPSSFFGVGPLRFHWAVGTDQRPVS